MGGFGVFRCNNCGAAYTKKEFEKLVKEACLKCKRAGQIKEIMPQETHKDPTRKLVYEQWNAGVERWYFWILEFLRDSQFFNVEKTYDVYTSSESSDFWGTIEQRKQLQADKASQFMATIGGMVKNLFQLLRELRITDERLDYYKGVSEGVSASDIALKGIWIDLVEGGAQKPTSVYGMATQVGFTTLPDYFFELFIKPVKDTKGKIDIEKTLASVDKIVNDLKEEGLNRKMREVLKRKLQEYVAWRERTRKEMEINRKFKLRYLRQHFHTIRLYMSWVKPYLRNVARLNMPIDEESERATIAKTETLRASEGAVIDLELLAWKPFKTTPEAHEQMKDKPFKFYYPCQRIIFHYRTKPEMLYRQEWQKGAVHVGITDMTFEHTALSKEEIDKYKKKQIEEDLELLGHIYSAITALEDDLIAYLKEADDEWAKDYAKEAGEKKKEDEYPVPPPKFKRKKLFAEAEVDSATASMVIHKILRKANGMITPGD